MYTDQEEKILNTNFIDLKDMHKSRSEIIDLINNYKRAFIADKYTQERLLFLQSLISNIDMKDLGIRRGIELSKESPILVYAVLHDPEKKHCYDEIPHLVVIDTPEDWKGYSAYLDSYIPGCFSESKEICKESLEILFIAQLTKEGLDQIMSLSDREE